MWFTFFPPHSGGYPSLSVEADDIGTALKAWAHVEGDPALADLTPHPSTYGSKRFPAWHIPAHGSVHTSSMRDTLARRSLSAADLTRIFPVLTWTDFFGTWSLYADGRQTVTAPASAA